MLAAITHFTPITTVRRARILPVPGRVVVRKGQKVNPTDTIAEANLNPEHLLLDIARGLGLNPAQADQHLQRKTGERVSEGDILAGPVGITRRVVRAPKDGKIVLAGSGQVLLELSGPTYTLSAALPGVVTELIADRGAEIETNGSVIQGAWGNGKLDYGTLSVVARSPGDELSKDRLDVSQRGAILLAGTCKDPEVLTQGAEIPLRGLILGSMDSALIPLAEKTPYPVLLTEGFGDIPMNLAAYRLLSTSDRREVALLAEAWDHYIGSRPEAIIPLPAGGSIPLPIDAGVYTPGQKVRVLGPLQMTQIGSLISVRPGLTALPNGVQATVAQVRLESGEELLVPLANLEVLE